MRLFEYTEATFKLVSGNYIFHFDLLPGPTGSTWVCSYESGIHNAHIGYKQACNLIHDILKLINSNYADIPTADLIYKTFGIEVTIIS